MQATPGRLDAPVRTLSGGNQQKVLFAKWLLQRPQILIADEPAAFADAVTRLLTEPGLATQIGHSARELSEARYAWSSAARTLEGFFTAEEMKKCADDTIAAAKKLKPGYCTVTDISQCKPLPPEAAKEIERVQEYFR